MKTVVVVVAGAAIGGGIGSMSTGGIAIAMAVLSLMGFAVAYFAVREMARKTGTPTEKYSRCVEMVRAEAHTCKHCGAVLAEAAAVTQRVGG